jgi:ribose 5-phosphate isomerase B
MRIAIGSDHAGFPLKEEVIQWLQKEEITVLDQGTFSLESVDYPDFASKVAVSVLEKEVDCGILICGSGNGMAMAANKYADIRAALCWTAEIASLAKQHNDANILVMPGRFLQVDEAIGIVKAYLSAEFEGGRHQGRVDKMKVLNQ